MTSYKLQIATNDDKAGITRLELSNLLKSVAWHIENYPHRSPGLVQHLHDKNGNPVGEYTLVARLED